MERTIAWFQNFRRLCIRYEKSTMLFQGFLRLGCSIILLKQVLEEALEERASTSTRHLEGPADFDLLLIRPFTCTQRGGRLQRWKGDTLRLAAPKP